MSSIALHTLPQQAQLLWDTEEKTAIQAQALANLVALEPIQIEFKGTLGAGKTTFIRYLLKALGVQGHIKSPTYAVVENYDNKAFPIWHFDFYRFNDPQEWEDAGFRDIFASRGLKLIEWPQQAQNLLPTADLTLEIEPNMATNKRQVKIVASTPTGASILQKWLANISLMSEDQRL